MSYLTRFPVLEAFAEAEDEVVVEWEIGEPHVDHIGHLIDGFDILVCFAEMKTQANIHSYICPIQTVDTKYRRNKTKQNPLMQKLSNSRTYVNVKSKNKK